MMFQRSLLLLSPWWTLISLLMKAVSHSEVLVSVYKLCGAALQKTTIFILIAVKTWNLTINLVSWQSCYDCTFPACGLVQDTLQWQDMHERYYHSSQQSTQQCLHVFCFIILSCFVAYSVFGVNLFVLQC
jgi:hypothetical protein